MNPSASTLIASPPRRDHREGAAFEGAARRAAAADRPPEASLLYRVFAAEWESWTAERGADDSRSPLPALVAKEVEACFRCGVLDHGFVLLSCDACGDHRPVAFSCKRRGI